MKRKPRRSEVDDLAGLDRLLRSCSEFEPTDPMPADLVRKALEPRKGPSRRLVRFVRGSFGLRVALAGVGCALLVATVGNVGDRSSSEASGQRPEARVDLAVLEGSAEPMLPRMPVARVDEEPLPPEETAPRGATKRPRSKAIPSSPWSHESVDRTVQGSVRPGWTTRRDPKSGALVVVPLLIPASSTDLEGAEGESGAP
jgi:hypothetical protein